MIIQRSVELNKKNRNKLVNSENELLVEIIEAIINRKVVAASDPSMKGNILASD